MVNTPILQDTFYLSQYPLFFMFFGFFIITVIFSYLTLSYLSLYGVFLINFLSLFLFWVSLLPFIDKIFFEQLTYNIFVFKWIFINYNFKININFIIDSISFSFFLLTTTIGLFAYCYAFCYFRYEPLVERFILFLCSFIISMLFLVSSGNIIMLFLGWEMIGLTSFFLINFWVNKVSTLKAAFKAFSFNKISDFFLLFALMGLYCLTYDIDILSINNQIVFFNNFKIKFLNVNVNILEMLSFLMISCSFIKSAQVGPHIWLPDSMEAPVPASSLIHSATLVSAGVFIILRFFPLFENTTYSFFLLPIIGSATAVYGGVVGAYQADIKRILAYSTISHCGFLIVMTSFNLNEFVIMYLYVHGFFKASVFMCVGNIIRSSKNYQDFRKMGVLHKCLPFEFYTSFVCLFNLAGLPFSLGFYIKHLIFLGFEKNIYLYYLVLFNIFCGAISGLFYSYRIFFYAFFDFKKANKVVYSNFNRKEYFSFYYTNTSILSNLSILGLVFTSYIMSFYLLSIFLNKINFVSDFGNFSNFSNFYNAFNLSNNYYLFNLSFINFYVVMFAWSIVILNYRKTFISETMYINIRDAFTYFIVFIILLHVC